MKPNSMKKANQEQFFNRHATTARGQGWAVIRLKPKGVSVTETIEAMSKRGLIARRGEQANEVRVYTKEELFRRVAKDIERGSNFHDTLFLQGNLIIVQADNGPIHVGDYRRWAELNNMPFQYINGMLYIERKEQSVAA